MTFLNKQWSAGRLNLIKRWGLFLSVLALNGLILASCVSTGEVVSQGDTNTKEKNQTGTESEKNISAKLEEYLENGKDKIFQGSYSEGISQLVTVLAEKEKIANPSSEIIKLASEAEKELTKLGAALALEADTAWLDPTMNQKTASSVDITVQPTVILTITQPTGRSLVSNAPIDFQFTKGSGIISGQANTNSYGQASCNIVRFENPVKENIIQASLIYKIKGYTYKFKGVERSFVYVPPSKKATVLVMEKSPEGVSSDPYILDPVFQHLKEISYDFSLFNGKMAEKDFTLVYEGNKAAIQKMGLEEGVSYLVIIYNDCPAVRQMELNGKKYNIYMADARATVRIIRTSDGKIMYQSSVERAKAKNSHGQGGSESKAIQDVLRKIADDMASKVEAELPSIKEVLGS